MILVSITQQENQIPLEIEVKGAHEDVRFLIVLVTGDIYSFC
jgi:hypothetical protein